jgi:hypothetical protein
MCGIGTAPFYALFFLDKEGPSGKDMCPKHALFCAFTFQHNLHHHFSLLNIECPLRRRSSSYKKKKGKKRNMELVCVA